LLPLRLYRIGQKGYALQNPSRCGTTSRFYLERGTEECDHASLAEIDVTVLPKIILLCDFLKDTSIVFEEGPDSINAVLRGGVLAL
jgi:hypothetical protein